MRTTSFSRTITASLALCLSPIPPNININHRNHGNNAIYLTEAYRIGDAVGILLKTTSSYRPHGGSFGGTSPSTTTALEAYRHQMPRFGVSTKTRFDVASLLGGHDRADAPATATGDDIRSSASGTKKEDMESLRRLRLSLSFDEGFHHIPSLDVYSSSGRDGEKKMLDNLVVRFVYSAGDGTIHAVHREAKYISLPSTSATASGRDDRDDNDNSQMPRPFFTIEYQWVEEADVDFQGGVFTLFLGVLIVTLSGIMAGEASGDKRDGNESVTSGRKNRLKNKHSSLEEGGGNNYRNEIGSDGRVVSMDDVTSGSATSAFAKRL